MTQQVPNELGHRTTPSYVSFTDTGILVGDAAKSAAPTNPGKTIFDAKRLIGRSLVDKDVRQDVQQYPFEVVNRGNNITISIDDTHWAPEEISAQVLLKMKGIAEAYTGESIEVNMSRTSIAEYCLKSVRMPSSQCQHISTMLKEQQQSRRQDWRV